MPGGHSPCAREEGYRAEGRFLLAWAKRQHGQQEEKCLRNFMAYGEKCLAAAKRFELKTR